MICSNKDEREEKPMTNNIRSNRKYTKDEKEKFISRILPPENYSVSELSKETDISKSPLATWKTKSLSGDIGKKQGRPSKSDISIPFWTTFFRTIYLNSYEFICNCKIASLIQSRVNALAMRALDRTKCNLLM